MTNEEIIKLAPPDATHFGNNHYFKIVGNKGVLFKTNPPDCDPEWWHGGQALFGEEAIRSIADIKLIEELKEGCRQGAWEMRLHGISGGPVGSLLSDLSG